MKITTFKNKKGLIHGTKYNRITCETAGILKVGNTEIEVNPTEASVLPVLFYGGTGHYEASFTDVDGNTYDLGEVTIRGGRIASPSPTEVELMELRCRVDIAETEREELRAEIQVLKNIFDTNSLNFLIKGETT